MLQPDLTEKGFTLWSKLMISPTKTNILDWQIRVAHCPVYHTPATHLEKKVPTQTLQHRLVKLRQTVSLRKFHCSWPLECNLKASYSLTEVCALEEEEHTTTGAETERLENAFPLTSQTSCSISQPLISLFSFYNQILHKSYTAPTEKNNWQQ